MKKIFILFIVLVGITSILSESNEFFEKLEKGDVLLRLLGLEDKYFVYHVGLYLHENVGDGRPAPQ